MCFTGVDAQRVHALVDQQDAGCAPRSRPFSCAAMSAELIAAANAYALASATGTENHDSNGVLAGPRDQTGPSDAASTYLPLRREAQCDAPVPAIDPKMFRTSAKKAVAQVWSECNAAQIDHQTRRRLLFRAVLLHLAKRLEKAIDVFEVLPSMSVLETVRCEPTGHWARGYLREGRPECASQPGPSSGSG